MAKNLGIRIPDGAPENATVTEGVLNPIVPSGTLGSIVMAIIAAFENAAKVYIDVEARTVYASDDAGAFDAAAALGSWAGSTLVGHLVQTEDARTAPWTRPGSAGFTIGNPAGVTALETLVARPTPNAMNVGSLVGQIEDAITAKDKEVGPTDVLGIGAQNAIVFVDQVAEQVTVVKVTDAEIEGVREALATVATVQFEQIPAEEAAGAETLAFE